MRSHFNPSFHRACASQRALGWGNSFNSEKAGGNFDCFFNRDHFVSLFLNFQPAISFYLRSPLIWSWSVGVRQVPSRMASTRNSLYYRSGNISDFANQVTGWQVTEEHPPAPTLQTSGKRPGDRRYKKDNLNCHLCSYFQFKMCGFWFEIIFYVFLVSHIVTTETSIERDNVVSENNQRGTLKRNNCL